MCYRPMTRSWLPWLGQALNSSVSVFTAERLAFHQADLSTIDVLLNPLYHIRAQAVSESNPLQ
jgi:hypothetical protein